MHHDEDETRPNPDALLEEAKKEQRKRGRLKIFLGAAPGVGKTYAMLEAAQKRLEEGVDLLAGIVETHGRKETQELLENIPVLPRYKIQYRERWFEEMDCSVILERHPQLVLVDEMAHTNIPGSRHAKRYLDIIELLDAGIDVYTTINIQHIDTLNDDIAQITRVHVRETVPDTMFELADDIIVIDLTPEELIQRMHEGKVYVPEQAQLAVRNFFTEPKLTALRELALRFAAKNVGQHLLPYMQAHGIAGPWPVSERIMVCLSASPVTPRLVRHAKRMAGRRDGKLLALYVESPSQTKLSPEQKERINNALRYVEQLGGEAVSITADNAAKEIIRYARENNVSHIIMGKSVQPRLLEFFKGSIVYEVIRQSGKINVHILSEAKEEREQLSTVRTAAVERTTLFKQSLSSLGFVSLALLLCLLTSNTLSRTTMPMIFLLAIIISATRYGLVPSLVASFASFLAYSFIFIEPIYSFRVGKLHELISLIVFVTVSILLSQLTRRVQTQAIKAQHREEETATIYAFTRKITRAVDLDSLLKAITSSIATKLKLHVMAILPDDNGIQLRSSWPGEEELTPKAWAAAQWAWENKKICGIGTETLSGVGWFYLPLQIADETIVLIAIRPEDESQTIDPDKMLLFKAMAEQAAVAIARMRLVKQAEQARLLSEQEKLRTALLAFASYDLITPLTIITDALNTIHAQTESNSLEQNKTTANVALGEAERLKRYAMNLLDVIKLTSGSLELQLQKVDLTELLANTVHKMQRSLLLHQLNLQVDANLPKVSVDQAYTQQLIMNLLDNAIKFSPPGSVITLTLQLQTQALLVSVTDQGAGIPKEDLARVFDIFYQNRIDEKKSTGPGLGLMVCRGLMEAQGGSIEAESEGLGRGAIFKLYFPIVL
ncbi:sensor histidine kinase KdpD [soil metagenome]